MNSIDEQSEISLTVDDISQRLQDFTRDNKSENVSNSRNICRVPPKLRGLHEHGFNPTRVAIGPLHYYDDDLLPMEAHKMRFLNGLLGKMTLPPPDVVEEIVISKEQLSDDHQNGAASYSSSSTNDNKKKIEHLVVAMKELEADTRTCYSETFNEISSSEFVTMMIIDSCFVVELLRLYAKNLFAEKGLEYVKDPIFNTRWLVQSLKHDLIMLENQLPFPVLKEMFKMTTSSEDDHQFTLTDHVFKKKKKFTLTDLTLIFFNSLLPRDEVTISKAMCTVDTKDHLLGLFWSSFLPKRVSIDTDHPSSFRSWVRILLRRMDFPIKSIKTYLPKRKTNLSMRPWVHDRNLLIHCVTELKEAGISFKKRENCELLDIKFKSGILYIPPLLIDDYTGLMFLNFVAYEQCNPSTEPYFTTYLLFLDSLLNSSKDVEHLHSKGILDHVLGSDEDVAQLFNKLCREVVHDHGDCYLSKVLEDVNQYFGVRSHRWRAKWKHDYFSSPWAFISLIAAVFLLSLTFIQTFMALFSYIKPRT